MNARGLVVAGNTREKLVTVGADRFYRRGFQAVGLDEILDEVGITKTAFYKHFDSKDDLIVAVLDHRDKVDMAEWNEFLTTRADNPRDRLLAIFDLLHQWFGRPDFRGCLFMNAATEFPSPSHPIHQTAARHGEHLHTQLTHLARLAGAADGDGLARQLRLLVTGAIAARHSGSDQQAAATAKAMAATLVDRECGRRKPA